MAITLDTTNGTITVDGTSTAPGKIRLYEDTDNGTNYIGLSSPDLVSTSIDVKLPSADGSSGQVIQTDGSGNLSFTAGGINIGKSIAMSLIFGL
jgi:hypothetical protein